jgi:glycerol uptake facilitator-like aquaporin
VVSRLSAALGEHSHCGFWRPDGTMHGVTGRAPPLRYPAGDGLRRVLLLSPADTVLGKLENAAGTAAGLFAIILMFGPVSGGHFNPVVSFTDAALGGMRWQDAAACLPARVAGCTGGAMLANLMFAAPAVSISGRHRASTRICCQRSWPPPGSSWSSSP